MAIVLLAERLAERPLDGASASTSILRLQPGAIANLPDEVKCGYRMCLWAAAVRGPELRCQRSRRIEDQVPDLALAQLGR